MRTLGDLLALWQYHHSSMGGFGFGSQVFQWIWGSDCYWASPRISHKRHLSDGSSQMWSPVPTRAGKSLRAVNSERLPWGEPWMFLQHGTLAFGAAELLWEML